MDKRQTICDTSEPIYLAMKIDCKYELGKFSFNRWNAQTSYKGWVPKNNMNDRTEKVETIDLFDLEGIHHQIRDK